MHSGEAQRYGIQYVAAIDFGDCRGCGEEVATEGQKNVSTFSVGSIQAKFHELRFVVVKGASKVSVIYIMKHNPFKDFADEFSDFVVDAQNSVRRGGAKFRTISSRAQINP